MPAAVAMPQSIHGSTVGGPSFSSSRATSESTRGQDRDRSRQQYASIGDEDYEGDDGEDEEDDAGTEDGVAGEQEEGAGGQELISETTVKSGYLYKRGEKRKNWKKRWFVLRSSKLFYYKNEKEYQLLRFIDMADVHTIAPVDLKKAEHSFGIVTSKRQYYVRASSAKEMQEWVDALRQIREAVRQRSTITRDMAMLDMSSPTPTAVQDGATSSTDAANARRRGTDSNTQRTASSAGTPAPPPPPQQQQQGGSPIPSTSAMAKQGTQASPISIVIPGMGLYKSPAQPRTTSSGGIMSPLSATSDSENGVMSGAEQFGLSYASSAGQSFGSSPGRPQHVAHTGQGSPQQGSGGDEEPHRRMRAAQHFSSQGLREMSTGSSAGEQQQGEGKSGLLSSSDEDGEGDEWDENEGADRAMPLPTHASGSALSPGASQSSGYAFPSTPAGPTLQSEVGSAAPAATAKPKVGSEFFKDPNKVILQGYLMKQSSRRKHWRKRWFTLTSGHLSYSRSHMDARAHRQIPLTSILDAIEYTPKKPASNTLPPLSPSLGSSAGSGIANTTSGTGISASTGSSSLNSALTFGKASKTAPGSADQGAGDMGGKGVGAGVTSPQSPSGGSLPIAERRIGTTQSISLASAPSFMSMPGAIGTLSTPGAGGKRKKENCFKIITPKRTFLVCAPSEEDELKWLSALRALLAHWRESQESTSASVSSESNSKTQSGSAEQAIGNDASANRALRSRSGTGLSQQYTQAAPAGSVTSPNSSQTYAGKGTTPSRAQMPSVSVTRPQEGQNRVTPQQPTNIAESGVPLAPLSAETTASSAASTVTPGESETESSAAR